MIPAETNMTYVGLEASLSDTALLIKALEGIGYTLKTQQRGGQWSCEITGQGETWASSGIQEIGALRTVLLKMFPSQGAWGLFHQHLRQLEKTLPRKPKIEPIKPISVVQKVEPPKIQTVKPAPTKPVAAKKPLVVEKPTDPNTAETLKKIWDEIAKGEEKLGMLSPFLQRAIISRWIARARVLQEKYPSRSAVEDEVHQIAKKLMALCRRNWPGSVRILQLDSTPAIGLAELMRNPPHVKTWEDFLDASGSLIRPILEEGEDGWKDSAFLLPAPEDADAVLAEAIAKIASVVGPMDMEHDARKKVSAETLRVHEDSLLLAAYLVRWVRKKTTARVKWAAAMGALRWVSREVYSDKLRDILSENFVPTMPLAQLLGRDAKVNQIRNTRKSTMENVPAEDAPLEDILVWLEKAFEGFTNPQIAKMGYHLRDIILELTSEDYSDADQNVRSRLRRLQSFLKSTHDLSQVSVAEEPVVPDETTPEEETSSALLQKVRQFTSGKNLLFVTNREDDLLQERLERDLQCTVIVKDGGNHRKLQAVLQAVAARHYDIVLVATGFSSQGTVSSLTKAAKSISIPCARVNKGRPVATIQALAQTFGINRDGT